MRTKQRATLDSRPVTPLAIGQRAVVFVAVTGGAPRVYLDKPLRMARDARRGHVAADEEPGQLRVSVFEVSDFEGVGYVAALALILELPLVRILMTRATLDSDALQTYRRAGPGRKYTCGWLMTH
jgi:hypothetical protein